MVYHVRNQPVFWTEVIPLLCELLLLSKLWNEQTQFPAENKNIFMRQWIKMMGGGGGGGKGRLQLQLKEVLNQIITQGIYW